jgi:metal-responsive CopG/Arc/MetJ family transcriptional regulator
VKGYLEVGMKISYTNSIKWSDRMNKTKTAISIDADLLNETNQIAEELDVSRSQIVSNALETYIQQYRNKKMLHQINEAYTGDPDDDEIGTMQIINNHRKKLGDREEWK